jgi:hypothetical protein
MDEAAVFILANKDLLPVILRIEDDQWSLPAPPQISWKPDQTLRQLVNYHVYDDAWVPDVLAGKTAAEVGDRFESLLGATDTVAQYTRYNKVAIDAVAGFKDYDRQVHLSYGDFTAREYLTHVTLFRGFRVYDFSKFLGFKPNLSPMLVQGLWDIVFPRAAELRAIHVIGEELPVPNDAPLLARVMALTGRT